MKKALALILAATMMLGLAACGSTGAGSSGSSASGASASVTTNASSSDTSSSSESTTEATTYATPELTLKFAEINAATGTVCEMEQRFADAVYEKTNGRVKIEIFGGGQLGTEAENIEQLGMGVIDIMRINPANCAARGIDIPEYTAIGLPYLIQSIEGGLEFLYSDAGNALADKVAEVSGGSIVSLYNYICTSPRDMYTKSLVTSLSEMKTQKIRSETSDVKVDMINCWASATPLSMTDIYSSLQTGVIDGCENTYQSYYDNAWYEVAPYCLETEHVIGSSIFLMSGDTWNKLTADEQTMMISVLHDACDWFIETSDQSDVALRQKLEGMGVVFTEANKQEFMDASAALYDKYAAGLEAFVTEIQSYK